MTELPPLPDGDDPREILGIGPDADATEIRRAYVRRIRQYRPETHPAEFARIRAAYEALGSGAELPESRLSRPVPAGEAADDPRWRAVAEAWERLADGDAEAGRETITGLAGRHPDWAPAFLHRFLIEDALDSPLDHRTAVLAEGLAAAVPLLPDLYELLDGEELRALAREDGAAWARLRRQPDRIAAVGLLRIRHQEQWLDGEEDRVYEEVLSPAFAEDAIDSAHLAWLAREAMAVAGWDRPEVAEKLEATYATREQAGTDLLPEDHYGMARACSADYTAWREDSDAPPDLDRLLRLAPFLDPPSLLRLATGLFSEFAAAPRKWFETLSGLALAAPAALDRYTRILRWMLDAEQAGGGTDRVSSEQLFRGLAEVDHRLRGGPINTGAIRRLLAAMILEAPVPPARIEYELARSRAGFSAGLRAGVSRLAGDASLGAFFWTRMLGFLLVRS